MPFIGTDPCYGPQKNHLKQSINKWDDYTKGLPLAEKVRIKAGKGTFIRIA